MWRAPIAGEHALDGRIDEHEAFMLDVHVAHIDHLMAAIEHLDAEALRLTHPFFAEQFPRCAWQTAAPAVENVTTTGRSTRRSPH